MRGADRRSPMPLNYKIRTAVAPKRPSLPGPAANNTASPLMGTRVDQRAVVEENVVADFWRDETVTLGGVEPLDSAAMLGLSKTWKATGNFLSTLMIGAHRR
jgi:hypothetical protein